MRSFKDNPDGEALAELIEAITLMGFKNMGGFKSAALETNIRMDNHDAKYITSPLNCSKILNIAVLFRKLHGIKYGDLLEAVIDGDEKKIRELVEKVNLYHSAELKSSIPNYGKFLKGNKKEE